MCHLDSDQSRRLQGEAQHRRDEVGSQAMSLLLRFAEDHLLSALREIERAAARDDGDTLTEAWTLFHRAPKALDHTVAEDFLALQPASPEVAE